MKIKFWGVRGSLPFSLAPGDLKNHFCKYVEGYINRDRDLTSFYQELMSASPEVVADLGGATTCVEVREREHSFLIDLGTGVKRYLNKNSKDLFQKKHHHIFMTHFHYDHLIGAGFFSPFFEEGQHVHFYFVQNDGEKYLKSFFQRPYFPLDYHELKGTFHFHKVSAYDSFLIDEIKVSAYRTDHRDECYGLKVISEKGLSYSHAVDHEAVRLTQEELKQDAGLFYKSDLLYIDAPYTEKTYNKNWGHGTLERAFKIAQIFSIPQVIIGHHDPLSTYIEIQKNINSLGPQISCAIAYDEYEVQLL